MQTELHYTLQLWWFVVQGASPLTTEEDFTDQGHQLICIVTVQT